MNLKYFKKIILVFFLLLFMTEFVAPVIQVSASGFTDIGEINNGFEFSTNKSNDMKFTGAKDGTAENFWNKLYDKYREVIFVLFGLFSLGFVGLFILNITKYGASVGNPQARGQAIKTIMWTGIAAALFGALTLIVGLSFALFK